MSTSGLMATGIPPQPKFLFFIKIAILGLSLLILALAAYSLSVFGGNSIYYYGYGNGAGGLLIFVTIKSFIVYGGATAIEIWAPHLFYRIIALVAYIISIIFWLSAWSWAASSARAWLAIGDLVYTDNSWKAEGGALAACAAFGAVVWVLSIVHLIFFVRACLADGQGTTQHQAELGNVKHEQPTQPVYAQQQPQYPQHPQQQQYPPQQPYSTTQ